MLLPQSVQLFLHCHNMQHEDKYSIHTARSSNTTVNKTDLPKILRTLSLTPEMKTTATGWTQSKILASSVLSFYSVPYSLNNNNKQYV